jgi:hypothetical protein
MKSSSPSSLVWPCAQRLLCRKQLSCLKRTSFEVATAKPNVSLESRRRIGEQPGGGFVAVRVKLKQLIHNALSG